MIGQFGVGYYIWVLINYRIIVYVIFFLVENIVKEIKNNNR